MGAPDVGRVRAFFGELSRRRVYRVTAIYTVLAAGGLELASVLLPSTRLPGWFDELFLGLAIVGLPLVLVLAWTFDVTEAGIERTPSKPPGSRSNDASEAAPPRGPPSPEEPYLDPHAVAVLPFENISGLESAEPFVVGLHDDLLTELSRASALTVISRTSVRSYHGSEKPMRQIARELGAGTIVEGGVQQAGSRMRLNIQVIDARTDGHVWAERYDRELTAQNIFELQSELAARIMMELSAQLTAEEQAREQAPPTGDLEAYRLFATGRHALIDRSEQGFRAAAALFERAIERDPEYALAWSGLGDALVGIVDYGHVDSEDVLRRGAEASARALELGPDLAEAHTAWGRLRSCVRDAPGAIAAHARASELRPSYAGAHQWMCWGHLLLGDGANALVSGTIATRLDPLDPEAASNLAFAHLAVGDAERALEEARRTLVRHPSFEWGIWVEGLSLLALGRWPEASIAMGRLRDRWTRGWPEVATAVERFAGGDELAARTAVKRLTEDGAHFKAGLLHALLGEADASIQAMRNAAPLPWDETLYLYVRPGLPLESLREDPRLAALIEDVRTSWSASDAVAVLRSS